MGGTATPTRGMATPPRTALFKEVMMVSSVMLLLLASTLAADEPHFGEPYTAADGRICRDKMEMVEEWEYDDQIHCEVQMEKQCNDDMDQVCHTMYKKECDIFYRPSMTKVKVKVCPNGVQLAPSNEIGGRRHGRMSVVMDVRPTPPSSQTEDACVNGRRKICVTKHETECATEYVEHEMMEDHPRCRIEHVESCSDQDKCESVPVMKCRIEKRKVMKTKPETKCKRVPRQFCRKVECNEEKEDPCYFRNQIINEIIPEEKCSFRPHRVCHPVRRSDTTSEDHSSEGSDRLPRLLRRSAGCEMVPSQKCRKIRTNPHRVMKEMIKRVCQDGRQDPTSESPFSP